MLGFKNVRTKNGVSKTIGKQEVLFHQKSSSIKGHLPLKVIFCQRSTSIKGRMVQNAFVQNGSIDPQTGGFCMQMEI